MRTLVAGLFVAMGMWAKTRWNSQHFTNTTLSIMQSNQNQVKFLVGITF